MDVSGADLDVLALGDAATNSQESSPMPSMRPVGSCSSVYQMVVVWACAAWAVSSLTLDFSEQRQSALGFGL